MPIFRYGNTELDHLKRKDKRLGAAMERIGIIECEIIPDLFTALINNIVGQQISNAASATVWNRMKDRFGEITPERLNSTTLDEVQQCGLSFRKAGYIKEAGRAVAEGKIDLSALPDLPDAEVIGQLSSLRGVGEWTAEMLLIFSMERPDVVSKGDLAIRRGMMTLYGRKTLDNDAFGRYARRYSPFGSVASLYLWEIAVGR
ncbi:MAG TPA: DNA-3-methyladenine glycosylase 2 family protein [Synergistetes bacterium]|nr:DNA-3-methyladenine glycosylase 2 family protein [Synergistota bacterium]